MKPHVGTKGGPNGDDELPALPSGFEGLKGPALAKAVLRAARGDPPQREARRWVPVSQATPAEKVAPRPQTTAPMGTPFPVDPNDYDDIPLPPEPEEEDWRD